MRMTRTLYLAAAITAVAGTTIPARAYAQSAQRVSIQASGLFVGTFGEAYEGLKNGPGVEAQIRYTPGVWSFGAGLQFSSHGTDEAEFEGETVKLTGFFVEPRRVIDVGSASFAPYVSARLAFLRQSIDVDIQGTSVSASASGTQINGGGGFLFRLTPNVNLDLGATYGLINFGDVEVTVPGFGRTTLEGTSGNGSNLVLRAGVAIGIR